MRLHKHYKTDNEKLYLSVNASKDFGIKKEEI
jgi:hypothetical protein